MEPHLQLFFSNRIECLYADLRDQLFKKGRHPFERKWVIVPSPAMKNWLMLQTATDEKVNLAFGFEVLYLNQALEKLSGFSLSPKENLSVLSRSELALAIENELSSLADSFLHMPADEKALFQPVVDFLAPYKNRAAGRNERTARRRADLSLQLGALFTLYGEYAPEEMKKWEKNVPCHWQAALWQRLFNPKSGKKLFTHVLQKSGGFKSPYPLEVHLFGISFLSEMKQLFFHRLGGSIPVSYWILSPSRMLWSDLLTEKEQLSLLKRLEKKAVNPQELCSLEALLQEGNPLLANCGRLGREWMKLLESLPSESQEKYFVSSSLHGNSLYEEGVIDGIEMEERGHPLTLLEALQSDLACMRIPGREKVQLSENDSSVAIHIASSKMREVEILYQALIQAIEESRHSEKPLVPADILVMVPDINQYEPYIRAVFGSEASQLDLQLLDLNPAQKNPYLQTFFHLIELCNSRWEYDSLLGFFESAYFRQKHSLSSEDISELSAWLKKEKVYWGETLSHRKELLARDDPELRMSEKGEAGTWQKAWDMLLLSLSFNISENEASDYTFTPFLPQARLSLSRADALGHWMGLFRSLRADLEPLAGHEEKALSEWAYLLTDLSIKYLAVPHYDEEGLLAERHLNQTLQAMARMPHKIGAQKICFSSFKIHLKALLEEKQSSFREQYLQAVRFCSLLPMRAVPARVIAWLGINEGVIPRNEPKNSLNLMPGFDAPSYCPTSTDFDRYLFLESLLSARDKWLITYVSSGSHKPGPSPLLQELLDYVDQSYLMGRLAPSAAITKMHPYYAFDAGYFGAQPALFNCSQRDYRSAVALQGQTKSRRFSFPSPLKRDELLSDTMPVHLNLNQLRAPFSHPMRFFLNQRHGIYLSRKKLAHDTMAEFEEEDWFFDDLMRLALAYPIEKAFEIAEKYGKLPLEPFKGVAKRRYMERIEEAFTCLHDVGVKPDEIMEVEFSHGCSAPVLASRKRMLVPPAVYTFQGRNLTVTGVLPNVAPQGLISYRNPKSEKIYSSYPEQLLISKLPENVAAKRVIFASAKGEEVALQEEKISGSAELLFEHYLRSARQPVPFLPKWLDPLLAKDREKLGQAFQQSIETSYTGSEDPYMQWVFGDAELPDPDQVIEAWHENAHALFGNFYHGTCEREGEE